jgi:membrane protein YqaA with SNARE-associated domain
MPDKDMMATDERQASTAAHPTPSRKAAWASPAILTLVFVLGSTILVAIFNEPIQAYGISLVTKYGQSWIDLILFVVTAVSCTPLILPVWGYTVAGVAMGYDVFHLATVMALGAALGGYVTYMLGRYFAGREWIQRRFPDLLTNKWTHGRSRWYVAAALFIGTSSPIPSDLLYAAAGAKQFPVAWFLIIMVMARFIRYMYLGLAFKYAIGM